MSRIGKLPVIIPENVEVKIDKSTLYAKGPKGELKVPFRSEVSVEIKGNQVVVTRNDDSKDSRAYHGLYRSLISNIIEGVDKGYNKDLEMSGVGYKCKLQGSKLILSVGYSHPVDFEIPNGIEIKVTDDTKISVNGIDKQLVGQVAAQIRKIKPCEPYKGKGIKYVGEVIRQKAGKAAKAAGA